MSGEQPLQIEDFRRLLTDTHSSWADRREKIVSLAKKKPLLIYGFGNKGRGLAEQLKMLGYDVAVFDEDSSRRIQAASLGFPVLESYADDHSHASVVILAACQAQLDQRRKLGPESIYYQEAANALGTPHHFNFAADFETTTLEQMDSLYKVYLSLQSSSRGRFLQVLLFRLTSNPLYLQTTRSPTTDMWLDVPREYGCRVYQTFVDVGAYDGDTLRSFQEKFACARGIAVEANEQLFDAIRASAVGYSKGIEILPVAAWSHSTRLKFSMSPNGMAAVCETNEGTLPAARLDAYIHEPVDIIKMDIEGAEGKALEGCSGLLQKYLPDLAIAAYHRPEDLVVLHQQIEQIGYHHDEFDWHFAHYSDCLDDSIFYIIRKQELQHRKIGEGRL